jgi:hypothetical protein
VDVQAVRIGVRVPVGNEMPVAGRIPGHGNAYVCATHGGMALQLLFAEHVSGASRSGAT